MFTALMYIGLAFMAFAPIALVIPWRRKVDKKRVALERISGLWSKRTDAMVRVEEMARLWKSEVPEQGEESEAPVRYEKPEMQRFHETYIDGKPYFNGVAGDVIQEFMRLLDKEGDCPSVVSVEGDPEADLEKSTFDILAKVPLYAHTIHVAEEMIKANSSGPTVAKGVIAALAHDIGKLPQYRKSSYSTGDHPLFSITALETIPKFKTLTYAKEILLAVRDHHGRPRDAFSQALREADQQARRRELAEHAKSKIDDKNQVAGAVAEGIAALEKTATTTVQNNETKEKDETKKPGQVELPWFSPERFLKKIKPRINRMEGGLWVAFSMKNGYVYVQAKVMWEAAEALGKEANDGLISLAKADEDLRRNILYTITSLMREYGAIAEDLIQKSYFGGQFILKMNDGKVLQGFYTPFKAVAFAETVSELEAVKEGKIRNITDVSPKYE